MPVVKQTVFIYILRYWVWNARLRESQALNCPNEWTSPNASEGLPLQFADQCFDPEIQRCCTDSNTGFAAGSTRNCPRWDSEVHLGESGCASELGAASRFRPANALPCSSHL